MSLYDLCMRKMHLRILAAAFAAASLLIPLCAQQSHWASSDDKTAHYIIDMERKWAEGVCVDNGVIAGLLAEDFQGTSTNGERFTKADELRDEKVRSHMLTIADSTRPKCASLAITWRSSTAANTPLEKTSPTRRQSLPDLDRHLAEARRQMADRRVAGQSREMQIARNIERS